MSLLKKYMIGAAAFTAMYKVCNLWDGKIEATIGSQTVMRPMLMGEKLTAFSVSMLYSPVGAPWWFMLFLDKVDMRLQGKRPEDLGYDDKKKWLVEHIIF